MKPENDEIYICECGQKIHISVFPAWQSLKKQFDIVKHIVNAIKALTEILYEK